MNIFDLRNSKKALTSKHWAWQYYGAIISGGKRSAVINIITILLSLAVLVLFILSLISHNMLIPYFRFSAFLVSVLLLWRTVKVVSRLNAIFCLRKQETRVTWSQILLLAVFGLFLVTLVEWIKPEDKSPEAMLLGGAGLLLGWIFQDTIKSVAAFFHLRINGLLKIGDWIIVSSHNVDGVVKKISLTTVTVENWDTTTSAFPTYILHAENFQNLEHMLQGKTYGRQMLKTFVIDTSWIHPLKAKEVEEIRIHADAKLLPFIEDAIKEERQNIAAFREYIYQMLLNNPKVSHHPRLLVRWLEQKNEGMPLQLYCYLTETSLAPFEWEQSQIIEKVIESMSWFGLQLYQSTSGFDASNSNIFLSKEPAKYEKKYDEE